MNDADVEKQIRQMVEFIEQEASEKADEIHTKALEDFNIEKLRLVEAGKEKIRQEFELKMKQIDSRKRIEFSARVNATRLEKLKAREELTRRAQGAALKRLVSLSDDTAKYSVVLAGLILEGALKLNEPRLRVRCREVDVPIVQKVLEKVAAKAKRFGLECLLTIDEEYLPPPPSAQVPIELACPGGVILFTHDSKIFLDNRLDTRLALAFEGLMPEIKSALFLEKA